MNSLTDQFLSGFAAEARSRIEAVRNVLDASEAVVSAEAVADITSKIEMLVSSASMLQLPQIAQVAGPIVDQLQMEAEDGLPADSRFAILNGLDELQEQLDLLAPGAVAAPPSPAPKPAKRTELPSDLLEIFAMEAEEH